MLKLVVQSSTPTGSPAPALSLGLSQALLHSSRLPTAGEAPGPRSVLTLLSGGTVAQDQVRETAGFPWGLSIRSFPKGSALQVPGEP